MLSMLKQKIKTIEVGRLTSKDTMVQQEHKRQSMVGVNKEEQLLVRYVVETEPDLFTDLASYWLFVKFMHESQPSNFTTHETAYEAVLYFIFEKFEQDPNLALYNELLFSKWLEFLRKIPDLKS